MSIIQIMKKKSITESLEGNILPKENKGNADDTQELVNGTDTAEVPSNEYKDEDDVSNLLDNKIQQINAYNSAMSQLDEHGRKVEELTTGVKNLNNLLAIQLTKYVLTAPEVKKLRSTIVSILSTELKTATDNIAIAAINRVNEHINAEARKFNEKIDEGMWFSTIVGYGIIVGYCVLVSVIMMLVVAIQNCPLHHSPF